MSGLRKLPDFQKIDPHLRTHPRFVAFRDCLGIETPLAHGLLAGLWAFAFDHARDGDLSRFTPVEIASSIGWQGDAETLMSALKAGFVIDGTIHDWHDWGGALFEARDKEARRKYDQYHAEQGKLSAEKTGESRSNPEKIPEEKRRELKEHVVKVKTAYTSDFEQLWIAFPPKPHNNKKAAFRCWTTRLRAGEEPERMIAAARHYATSRAAKDPLFTMLASTFLGPDLRYEEYVDDQGGNGNGNHRGQAGHWRDDYDENGTRRPEWVADA